jgi:hypothetical protein
MKAIEFETTAKNHLVQLPEDIPDGKKIRVLVLFDEQKQSNSHEQDIKALLASISEGLEDNDLRRQYDFGREAANWLT